MFKKFSKIAGTIATATLEGIIIAEATRQEMIAEKEPRREWRGSFFIYKAITIASRIPIERITCLQMNLITFCKA